MNQSDEVASPVVKVATLWATIYITSWTDAAAAIAFFYTMALFAEWLWKKIIRPLLLEWGWVKDRRQRFGARAEDHDDQN